MDKRILGSIITILILLGVLWVFAISTTNTIDTSFIKTNMSGHSGNWTATWDSNPAGANRDNITLNFTIYTNFVSGLDTNNITNITITQNNAYFNITKIINYSGTFVFDGSAGEQFSGDYADCKTVTTRNQGIRCFNRTGTTNTNISGNATITIIIGATLNYTYESLAIESPTASSWEISVYTNNSKDADTITAAASEKGNRNNFTFGIDDLRPRIRTINISDGTYTRSGKDGHFNNSQSYTLLNNSDIIVNITVDEYNREQVYVFWGQWNGTLKANAGTLGTWGSGTNWTSAFTPAFDADMLNMTRNCVAPEYDSTIQTCMYGAIINNTKSSNFSDGTTYTLMFWTNDTFNHEANFSNGGSGYNFTIDGDDPGATITMPKTTTIYAGRSITIKCETSDDDGFTYLGTITITSPSGRVTSKQVNGEYEATFSGINEVGNAGVYDVTCETTDKVGHSSNIAEATFKVLTRGGGAGVAGEEPVAEVDLSTTETPIGGISGVQGESDTFTIDGVTAHRITFIEVGLDYAKMTIESTPVEFTLNIGESEELDLTGDGVNDVKVTLSSIVNGKAEVSVTNIEKYEEKLEEERIAREGPAEKGGWGLWITLLVIAVLIVVGYFVLKARSKKGSVHFSRQDLGL